MTVSRIHRLSELFCAGVFGLVLLTLSPSVWSDPDSCGPSGCSSETISSTASPSVSMVAVLKTYGTKQESLQTLEKIEESVGQLSLRAHFRSNPDQLQASLEKMSEKMGELMHKEGYDASPLLYKAIPAKEMKYFRNSADRILAATKILKEIKKTNAEARESILFHSFYQIGSVYLTVAAVNISAEEKEADIKTYLPKEIIPEDVIESANMKMSYDRWKSQYYAYEKVLLKPHEIRVFNIRLEDVWRIPASEIKTIRQQIKEALTLVEGTSAYEELKPLVESIEKKLERIGTKQEDDSLSREEHMLVYSGNQEIMREVIGEVEQIADYLLATGAKTPAQAQDMENYGGWKWILGIIGVLGMVGGGFYFRWFMLLKSRQAYPSRPNLPVEDKILLKRQQIRRQAKEELEQKKKENELLWSNEKWPGDQPEAGPTESPLGGRTE